MKPYTSCENQAKKLFKILVYLILLAVILTVVRQAYIEIKQEREERIKTEKLKKKKHVIVHKLYLVPKEHLKTRKHELYK